MDELINILRGTLVPEQNKEAEQLLGDIKKIYKFCPNLLQVSMREDLEDAVRQAASVTLKNNIIDHWQQLQDSTVYSIHEDDKHVIRTNILSAIINGPGFLQQFFLESLKHITRYDFPGRWSTFPDEVLAILNNESEKDIYSGYLALLSLVKNYRYKKSVERKSLNLHMPAIMAKMQFHMTQLMSNESEMAFKIKKTILKIFSHYTQYMISFDVIGTEVFSYWVQAMCHIITTEVQIAPEDPTAIWWKCKKWAIKTIVNFLSRYANPNSATKDYKEFSVWFLGTCVESIIRTMFVVCEQFSSKKYVAPRVLSYAIGSFEHLIKTSNCWKYLKPHFDTLLKEILFKLMMHNESEDEMWKDDPVEYIRNYFDALADPTPTYAASTVLKDFCSKRRGVLDQVMNFVIEVLNSEHSSVLEKDAALRVIGEISTMLLKKPTYASGLESFLKTSALPVMKAPEGFRRGRVCWLLGMLSEAEFSDAELWPLITGQLMHMVSEDPELPVRVFALHALSDVLCSHSEELKPVLAPHLTALTVQCLNLLKESEVDELNDALQTFISVFPHEFMPLTRDAIDHLKSTLIPLLKGDISDEKEYVIIGMLSSIETLAKAAEDNEEIILSIEPLILQIINEIFAENNNEFYEEAYSLANSLTSNKITDTMWQVLLYLEKLIETEPEEMTDMMYLLENYVTQDKPGLVTDPARITAVINIAKHVINIQEEELDTYQAYGAKLLEMVLINYKACPHQLVDPFVPQIIEVVLQRLMKPVVYSDTAIQCITTVLAALYYDQDITLNIMMQHDWPGTSTSMINEFIRLMFEYKDKFRGIHDRKMFVFGVSSLMGLPADKRPAKLAEIGHMLMPELLKVMEGLKETYVKLSEDEEQSEYDDDDYDSDKELGSDENDNETGRMMYLRQLEENDTEETGELDGEDGESDDEAIAGFVTELESYETDLDEKQYEFQEFMHLYSILSELNSNDTTWYNVLFNSLTPQNQTTLKNLVEFAQQHKKDYELKQQQKQQQ